MDLHGPPHDFVCGMSIIFKILYTLHMHGDIFLFAPITIANADDHASFGAASSLWNKFPADLRHSPYISTFKFKLKA